MKMKRFLHILCLVLVLTLPLAVLAQTPTYVFPYEGFRYSAQTSETVLTQENLGENEAFIKSLGTTPDAILASFQANQIVMEVLPEAGGQIAISVAHSDDFKLSIDVTRMDEQTRADFLASFADSGLYEDVAWSTEASEYLRMTNSAMISNVPVYALRYVTLRHGQLYLFTNTIVAREVTPEDDQALLDIIASTEYLGQLATPAPTPTPTPVPTPSPTPRPTPGVAAISAQVEGLTLLVDDMPAWTDEEQITIKGTSMNGAALELSVNGKTIAKATAKKDGSFTLKGNLPEEGDLTVTVSATLKDQTDASQTFDVQYEIPTTSIEITEPLGHVDSESVYLRGITQPNATVYISGTNFSTNVKANGKGAFSIKLKVTKEGDYTYTVTSKLDGWHAGSIEYTLSRIYSEREQYAAFRNSLTTIDYSDLRNDTASFIGKNISVRGRIDQFHDYDGMPCLLLYTRNPGKGNWTEPVWVLCDEILSFEIGDIKTVLATIEGATLPFTNADGDTTELPVIRLKFYND